MEKSNSHHKPSQTKKAKLLPNELDRYARHICLPEIGLQGQEKLKAASVLCVGMGGLGSPIALYLAAAGIGRIGLIDFDWVEESNLQRQIIHGMSSIGLSKISSAKKRINEINPECQIDLFETSLTSENALNIIEPYDVICDGTDNFASKYLINDACILLDKPYIYGSVQRFEGQASVFNLNSKSPNYRDLIPEPPPPELIPNCAEAGVIGVLPGLIGLIQATETIKIITEIGEPLDGRLLVFSALTMTFKELKLKKRMKNSAIKKLIDYEEFCNPKNIYPKTNKPIVPSISAKELKNLLDENNESLLLIDVRSPTEAEAKSIKGSKLFPLNEIDNQDAINLIKKISLKKKIYVYCKSGIRSEKAIDILNKHGIFATNIKGGIQAWEKMVAEENHNQK